eukprot:TRINITY_DN29316_c0_g1_i1.p1 TRINITY_DN29316_c0_g1~~TRINITY_DN29316_c0_g1_i1.p1  ORF type:complete len:628 (+),score=98.11 TRINITY_DN29316_c0_g1_i1:106-1989(+)
MAAMAMPQVTCSLPAADMLLAKVAAQLRAGESSSTSSSATLPPGPGQTTASQPLLAGHQTTARKQEQSAGSTYARADSPVRLESSSARRRQRGKEDREFRTDPQARRPESPARRQTIQKALMPDGPKPKDSAVWNPVAGRWEDLGVPSVAEVFNECMASSLGRKEQEIVDPVLKSSKLARGCSISCSPSGSRSPVKCRPAAAPARIPSVDRAGTDAPAKIAPSSHGPAKSASVAAPSNTPPPENPKARTQKRTSSSSQSPAKSRSVAAPPCLSSVEHRDASTQPRTRHGAAPPGASASTTRPSPSSASTPPCRSMTTACSPAFERDDSRVAFGASCRSIPRRITAAEISESVETGTAGRASSRPPAGRSPDSEWAVKHLRNERAALESKTKRPPRQSSSDRASSSSAARSSSRGLHQVALEQSLGKLSKVASGRMAWSQQAYLRLPRSRGQRSMSPPSSRGRASSPGRQMSPFFSSSLTTSAGSSARDGVRAGAISPSPDSVTSSQWLAELQEIADLQQSLPATASPPPASPPAEQVPRSRIRWRSADCCLGCRERHPWDAKWEGTPHEEDYVYCLDCLSRNLRPDFVGMAELRASYREAREQARLLSRSKEDSLLEAWERARRGVY